MPGIGDIVKWIIVIGVVIFAATHAAEVGHWVHQGVAAVATFGNSASHG